MPQGQALQEICHTQLSLCIRGRVKTASSLRPQTLETNVTARRCSACAANQHFASQCMSLSPTGIEGRSSSADPSRFTELRRARLTHAARILHQHQFVSVNNHPIGTCAGVHACTCCSHHEAAACLLCPCLPVLEVETLQDGDGGICAQLRKGICRSRLPAALAAHHGVQCEAPAGGTAWPAATEARSSLAPIGRHAARHSQPCHTPGLLAAKYQHADGEVIREHREIPPGQLMQRMQEGDLTTSRSIPTQC